jgi:16S rRNA (uracil1498-N3)-methyltransferase
MSLHRVWLDGPPPTPGDLLRLTGDEARHAVRVKRLAPGDHLELLDGAGLRAHAVVERTSTPGSGATGVWLDIRIASTGVADPVSPCLEVCSAVPKGPRAAELVEQLSQVGAASWRPLVAERSVVDPGDAKLDRLRRVALESAKQCGRPWVMAIDDEITLTAALDGPGPVIVADASGGPLRAATAPAPLRLLIGPEGGWTPRELDAIAAAPTATLARFGPHVMRIETAAVAAAAVIINAAR